jgi:hypothetical protein
MLQHVQQPSGASCAEDGVRLPAADRAGPSSGRRQQEAADSGEDSDADESRKFWVGSDCVQRVNLQQHLRWQDPLRVVTVSNSTMLWWLMFRLEV